MKICMMTQLEQKKEEAHAMQHEQLLHRAHKRNFYKKTYGGSMV
jgi:hypothetical protein